MVKYTNFKSRHVQSFGKGLFCVKGIHLAFVVRVFWMTVQTPVVPLVVSVTSYGAVFDTSVSMSETLLMASARCVADSVDCFLHI